MRPTSLNSNSLQTPEDFVDKRIQVRWTGEVRQVVSKGSRPFLDRLVTDEEPVNHWSLSVTAY